MSDWNAATIEEFRANGGKVGGHFDGKDLLLLHHRGARTGIDRVTPLRYQAIDGGYAVFASKAGADTNPDWLYNVQAHPAVEVEVGTETIAVTARLAAGDEYARIWERQKRDDQMFADYERTTARDHIPVVVLERV